MTILDRTAPDGDCMIWQGAVQSRGYGWVRRDGRPWLAHRLAYTLSRGPIPADMTIDHLCGRKLCLNVDHMEIVTRAENTLRQLRALRAQPSFKCGHPRTPDNISYGLPGNRGGPRIQCRLCRSGKPRLIPPRAA